MMARFDERANHWVLWENPEIRVVVQQKANWPAKYGGHVVVEQKIGVKTPYDDYALFGRMSVVAAVVQKGMEETGLAPHANIQSNANWAFRKPDGGFRGIKEGQQCRNLHFHICGRDPKDPGWGEPIRPAYFKEQQEGKYWDEVWSEVQLQRIAAFLELEIPIGLRTLK